MLEQIELIGAASNRYGPKNLRYAASVPLAPQCEDQMKQSEKTDELTKFKFAIFFALPVS